MIPRFGCRRRIVSYGTPRRGRPWLTRPMSLFARACRSRPPQVSCQPVSMPRGPGRLGVAVRKGSIGAWPCIDLRDISCRPGGRAQEYYIITIIRPITDKREIQTGPDTAWAVRWLDSPLPSGGHQPHLLELQKHLMGTVIFCHMTLRRLFSTPTRVLVGWTLCSNKPTSIYSRVIFIWG